MVRNYHFLSFSCTRLTGFCTGEDKDHGLENRLVARIHLRLIRWRSGQASPSRLSSRGWSRIFPATILRIIRTFSPQAPPQGAGERSWALPFFKQPSSRSVKLSLAGVAIVTIGLCAFIAVSTLLKFFYQRRLNLS